jgi:hypothetical protein
MRCLRVLLIGIFAICASASAFADTPSCKLDHLSVTFLQQQISRDDNQYVADYWLKFTNLQTNENYLTQFHSVAVASEPVTKDGFLGTETTTNFVSDPTTNFITLNGQRHTIIFTVNYFRMDLKVAPADGEYETNISTSISFDLTSKDKSTCNLFSKTKNLDY